MLDRIVVKAIDHLIRQSPGATDRLRPYSGMSARLHARLLDVRFVVSDAGTLSPFQGATDIEISVPSAALSLSPMYPNAKSALRDIQVTGHAEFAEVLGGLLRKLRWDMADDLSPWIGDIAAERLATAGRRAIAQAGTFTSRLTENFGEYLIYEADLLTGRDAIDSLSEALDGLSEDIFRLESRIQAIERRG